MSPKQFTIVCMTIGSFIGGYLPTLWGSSLISFSSIVLTAVGGFAGIYIGYRMSHY